MSRPFNGSLTWWREELTQLAQITHQGHVEHGNRIWRHCPMASCTRFRDVLGAASAGDEKMTDRWALRRAAELTKQSKRLRAVDSMTAEDTLRTVCFELCGPKGEETGDVCL